MSRNKRRRKSRADNQVQYVRDTVVNANGKSYGSYDYYTPADDAIIKNIIATNPNWTLHDIKQSITTVHPMNVLKRHVAQFVHPAELEAHMIAHPPKDEPLNTPASEQETEPNTAETTIENEIQVDNQTTAKPATEETETKSVTTKHRNLKSAMTKWTDRELNLLRSVWPHVGTGRNSELIWCMLLPNRSPAAIASQINRMQLTRSKRNTLKLDAAFTQEDNDMLLTFFDEYGGNSESWKGLLSKEFSTQRIIKQANTLKTLKQITGNSINTPVDINQEIYKSVIDDANTMEDNSMTTNPAREDQYSNDAIFAAETKSDITIAQMLAKLRELQADPAVTMSVYIDFGNGLTFECGNKRPQNLVRK